MGRIWQRWLLLGLVFVLAVGLWGPLGSVGSVTAAGKGVPQKLLKSKSLGLATTAKGEKEYKKFVAKVVAGGKKQKTELEKVFYLHNELAVRIKAFHTTAAVDVPSSAYGVIVNRVGNGHGYAHAFYLLAKELGLTSKVVRDKTWDNVWNLVKVDGKYYHVNVSGADGSEGDGVRSYAFFLNSDKMVGVPMVGKKVATSKKYAYFADARYVLAVKGRTIYHHDWSGNIRKLTLTGKRTAVYKGKGTYLTTEGEFLLNYQVTKGKGGAKSRVKVTKVRYDGKEKVIFNGVADGIELTEWGLYLWTSEGMVPFSKVRTD